MFHGVGARLNTCQVNLRSETVCRTEISREPNELHKTELGGERRGQINGLASHTPCLIVIYKVLPGFAPVQSTIYVTGLVKTI